MPMYEQDRHIWPFKNMSSTTLYCTLYFQVYNRKRSSFLNSVCAPPGSYIKPDYQFVTKFTNRFTHLNSKKCKKVKKLLNVHFILLSENLLLLNSNQVLLHIYQPSNSFHNYYQFLAYGHSPLYSPSVDKF